MNCSICTKPANEALSYLGEPLCDECVEWERTDETPEAVVEQYARDNLPWGIHRVSFEGVVYEVAPGDGRDWTAAPLDHEPDGVLVEMIE